jgi:hypothetical protein
MLLTSDLKREAAYTSERPATSPTSTMCRAESISTMKYSEYKINTVKLLQEDHGPVPPISGLLHGWSLNRGWMGDNLGVQYMAREQIF